LLYYGETSKRWSSGAHLSNIAPRQHNTYVLAKMLKHWEAVNSAAPVFELLFSRTVVLHRGPVVPQRGMHRRPYPRISMKKPNP